ncbi:adenylyl-sulfate kinase [Stakelama saccharophila]|uniref:Adenylyl-sulfate kinase n=1 Tax=Stakelama saccharophila TaxID=3075605 RepID=A0ABZ0B4T4_9SPHN|nr:adenylyl-sulfate kinase [Stakelama sp. W311]WNO52401.1 adenylyl-sulfate kinase [Stakelama sp. W311]
MSPEPDRRAIDAIVAQIDAALRDIARRPIVLGLCGAQGSGKSTIAATLERRLRESGTNVATLSLDDLYLTHTQRRQRARNVHPLFATRGVPGTHDIALGEAIFAALDAGAPTRLPRFDKSSDDRARADERPILELPLDVLIFEGWCVGAQPQPAEALASPINMLEADEDPDGIWRRYANDALARPYQRLFARIDRLVLLAAPSFAVVRRWRLEQEEALRRDRPHGRALMDRSAIDRFIAHYERLTRHILIEMPDRADLVLRLDEQRRVRAIN